MDASKYSDLSKSLTKHSKKRLLQCPTLAIPLTRPNIQPYVLTLSVSVPKSDSFVYSKFNTNMAPISHLHLMSSFNVRSRTYELTYYVEALESV